MALKQTQAKIANKQVAVTKVSDAQILKAIVHKRTEKNLLK